MISGSLNIDMKEELERKIFFVSEYIEIFEVVTRDNQIIAVDLSYDENKISKTRMQDLLDIMIEKELHDRICCEHKELWSNKNDRTYCANVFQQLVNEEEVVVMSKGVIGLGEKMHRLCVFFDNEIVRMAQECFEVKLMWYPSLLRYDSLDKVDYVKSLPQFLMFVSALHADASEYNQYKDKGFDYEDNWNRVKGLKLCLPPSVCYHAYQQYSGKCLERENIVISAIGQTFRNEGKYAKTLERLWNFTMREVIFLGEKKYIEHNNMVLFMNKIIDLMNNIGFVGRIVSADDLFYKGKEDIDIRILKKIKKSKYELKLNLDEKKELAVGSFNLHGDFFGKAFGIEYDKNKYAHTSCTGYGLERLAYAFLCQFGVEEEKWPQYVKERI